MKKYLTLIFLVSFLLLPANSLAVDCNGVENNLNLCYPSFGPNGGFLLMLDTNLNQLIAWFYYFIVGIAGLSAFVMLVWGGVQWLTSVGSPSKITGAKDKITSALLGLLIILGSWLILQVINPELTILSTL